MKTNIVLIGKASILHAVYQNTKYMGHIKESKVGKLDDDAQNLAAALGLTYFDTCYLAGGLPFLTIGEAANAIIENKCILATSNLN
jgi:hypothetical protein